MGVFQTIGILRGPVGRKEEINNIVPEGSTRLENDRVHLAKNKEALAQEAKKSDGKTGAAEKRAREAERVAQEANSKDNKTLKEAQEAEEKTEDRLKALDKEQTKTKELENQFEMAVKSAHEWKKEAEDYENMRKRQKEGARGRRQNE